ncbi:MAG TPA: hypothetical protein VMM81_05345 [Acidimicrobiia bacterium]|nr:hypothetical protein [Acidimicrobiia bacterium]
MTTTLTRPETQRPAVPVTPSRFPMITLLVAAGAIATAVLVGLVAGPGASDTSYEVAELARQTALAPVDASSSVAEYARQAALGAVAETDDSHHVAEGARMIRFAPIADDSFGRNEAARQAGLAD